MEKFITRSGIATGEIFHIINRGVDKRHIFLDEKDYFRFIHNLFEFNDKNAVTNSGHFLQQNQSIDLRNRYDNIQNRRKPRELIVEILAFCLMPNHFHLLLKQKEDGGITKFMRKLGIGYANYFNQRYSRSGTLFQGRYKSILISQESHFTHLPYYIHLNPLDLIAAEWRIGKIKNYQKALDFLNSYRWSSHLDYTGRKNFPSLTQKELLLSVWGSREKYNKSIKNWLKEMSAGDIENIKKIILE